MLTNNKEIHLDIGGGKEGRFLASKAILDPQNIYISLDPEVNGQPSNLPDNLYLVRWSATEPPMLPFRDQNIDYGYMNFVYDSGGIEWQTDRWIPVLLPGEKEYARKQPKEISDYFFRKILSEMKRVLKINGQICISDIRGKAEIITSLLIAEGFYPESVSLIQDIKRSLYTEVFYETSHINPDHRPIEIRARLAK